MTAAWFGAVASVPIGGAGTLRIVAIWMKIFPSLGAREQLAQEACT